MWKKNIYFSSDGFSLKGFKTGSLNDQVIKTFNMFPKRKKKLKTLIKKREIMFFIDRITDENTNKIEKQKL